MAFANDYSNNFYTDFADYSNTIFETNEYSDPDEYTQFDSFLSLNPAHLSRNHHTSSYQSQQAPRSYSFGHSQQPQIRNPSVSSNQSRHLNNMSSNQYQIQSPQTIIATRSPHDPPWSPEVPPQSLEEDWLHARHVQRPHSNSTNSGSTNASTNSNNGDITSTRHNQSYSYSDSYIQSRIERHNSSYNSSASNTQNQPSACSPSSSTSTSQRPACMHEDCVNPATGVSLKTFSRKADLVRHVKSAHEPELLDCPYSRCERRGANGFTRKDHLTEHQRGYHRRNIVKRNSRGRRGRRVELGGMGSKW